MTLFSQVPRDVLDAHCESIAQSVASSFESSDLYNRIKTEFINSESKIFLLTHCPELLAEKIRGKLGFDGQFSIAVQDHFSTKGKLSNFDKKSVLINLKKMHFAEKVVFVADDFIDFKCLKAADTGILVNASKFTKFFAKFYKNIQIWD